MNQDNRHRPQINLAHGLLLLIFVTCILAPSSTNGQQIQTNEPKLDVNLAKVLAIIDEEIAEAERREKDPKDQNVTLNIKRVRLNLAIITTVTQQGGVEFEVPVVQLKADGSVEQRTVNTQSFVFDFLPTDNITVSSDRLSLGLTEEIIQVKRALRASLSAPTRFYPALVTIEREFDLIYDAHVGFKFFVKAGAKHSSKSSQRIHIEMSVIRR